MTVEVFFGFAVGFLAGAITIFATIIMAYKPINRTIKRRKKLWAIFKR